MTDPNYDDINAMMAALGDDAPSISPDSLPDAPEAPLMDRPTELANADALIRIYGDNLRFDVDAGKWLVWNGSTWGVDDVTPAKWAIRIARDTADRLAGFNSRDLKKHVENMEKSSGVKGVLALARNLGSTPIRHTDLDRDPYLFVCQNAAIQLQTGAIRPAKASDLITMASPVIYREEADCPLFEQFLLQIFDGNDALIQYVQRLGGLCMTGDTSVQELWIPYGVGANGKSTLFDTIGYILGPYACAAPDGLLVAKQHTDHPTEIATLAGKRLVIASETEVGGRLRTQLVKKLTGDAVLTARFMRQDYFQFSRTHKLILITNNRPVIDEDSEAVWRRIRLIPFETVIPADRRDPDLLAKLRGEASGILNWLIEGYRQYRSIGMSPPPEVMAATDTYRQDSDDGFDDFLAASIIIGEGMTCTRSDLADEYARWTDRHNVKRPMDKGSLFERVRRIKGVEDDARRIDGKVTRVFRGIALSRAQSDANRDDGYPG